MARFHEEEGVIYFTPVDEEGYSFELHDDNFVAYAHREEPLYDVIQVQDPRDEGWWHWWRYSTKPEAFDGILDVAERIGSVVLRNYAAEPTTTAFDEKHNTDQYNHDDLVALTDEEAELFTDDDFEVLLTEGDQ